MDSEQTQSQAGPVLGVPDAARIRDELADLVVRDLHGPINGPEEELAESPSDWYVIGRLAPSGTQIRPEELDPLSTSESPSPEEGDPDVEAPATVSLHPSSVGFSARIAGDTDTLEITAAWGRYHRSAPSREDGPPRVWKRIPRSGRCTLKLVEGAVEPVVLTADEPEILLKGRIRRYGEDWLLSLFLVNAIPADPARTTPPPGDWIFQVELAARAADGGGAFLPRHTPGAGGDSADQDEQRAQAMVYRFHPEFAVGHGSGVHTEPASDDPMRAVEVRTAAAPSFELPHTDVPGHTTDPDLPELADLVLDMKLLANLDAAALRAALMPLVTGYRAWIERAAARVDAPEAHLADYGSAARRNLAEARIAADRVEAGIHVLADANALEAFRFANQAMYLQRVHGIAAARRRQDPRLDLDAVLNGTEGKPGVDLPANRSWRPFQLAFLLLNLPALADPGHPDRSADASATADLLWFPTGGGKTEAYLGLTAFTLAIRRLRPDLAGRGAQNGVAVLMRYTLRLLTIQQFQRAAALICACEVQRRADPATWGTVPFRIGLWVGRNVTPNSTKRADEYLRGLRRSGGAPGRSVGSLHQITSCPWCGSVIEPARDIAVDLTVRRSYVRCPDLFACPFGGLGTDPGDDGLPVVLVDEEIYRLLPSLLIATVDKFAQLPWAGQTQALFGHVTRRCTRHGYVTTDQAGAEWESATHVAVGSHRAATTETVPAPRPPDLIIQDELHLISGPLGSLAGLYESAIDLLATWEYAEGRKARPKVIASTATARRSERQIHALFNRRTRVFPPQGLEVSDSFFARQRPVGEHPGRRYVGVCAPGARAKDTLIRVYVATLAAAQLLHQRYGRNPVTDPYMTLVGYFNSLRELGGMRRSVEDDVSTRLSRANRRGLAVRTDPYLQELTSRLSSDAIPKILDRLEHTFAPRTTGPAAERPIDVLLATNMIAVGVDVPRLGVMVVANQPKSSAEYIQATSRVGRAAPGLVFTVFNWARPRDLSHYETFEHFHATVYRHVEALSVTPFAERAIDRGLTGVLVGLVRDLEADHNGNLGAQSFDTNGKLAAYVARYLTNRANDVATDRRVGDEVRRHLDARLDLWAREQRQPGAHLAYRGDRRTRDDTAALLREPDEGRWRMMTCPTSLRDVEPAIRLVLLQNELRTGDEPSFGPRAGACAPTPEGRP